MILVPQAFLLAVMTSAVAKKQLDNLFICFQLQQQGR